MLDCNFCLRFPSFYALLSVHSYAKNKAHFLLHKKVLQGLLGRVPTIISPAFLLGYHRFPVGEY
jgi:hypothetical protein